MELAADRGGLREQPGEEFFLDGRAAGLAGSVAAKDGFGDEGVGGQAGFLDAGAKLLPQLGGRAVGDGGLAAFSGLFCHGS